MIPAKAPEIKSTVCADKFSRPFPWFPSRSALLESGLESRLVTGCGFCEEVVGMAKPVGELV